MASEAAETHETNVNSADLALTIVSQSTHLSVETRLTRFALTVETREYIAGMTAANEDAVASNPSSFRRHPDPGIDELRAKDYRAMRPIGGTLKQPRHELLLAGIIGSRKVRAAAERMGMREKETPTLLSATLQQRAVPNGVDRQKQSTSAREAGSRHGMELADEETHAPSQLLLTRQDDGGLLIRRALQKVCPEPLVECLTEYDFPSHNGWSRNRRAQKR